MTEKVPQTQQACGGRDQRMVRGAEMTISPQGQDDPSWKEVLNMDNEKLLEQSAAGQSASWRPSSIRSGQRGLPDVPPKPAEAMTGKVPQTRDDLAEALRNAGQFAHPAMDHWYCLADAVLRWREAWIAEALRCAVMEQEEPRKIPPPGEVFVRKNT